MAWNIGAGIAEAGWEGQLFVTSQFELHSYTKRILFIQGFMKSILLQATSETISSSGL
jgi:hypothetical protein